MSARASTAAANHDERYEDLRRSVTVPNVRLFTTDVDGAALWATYLNHLPTEQQVHNCHACRHFIGRYGGLVTVDDAGRTSPAAWRPDAVPDFYRPALTAMHALVAGARVTGVFLTSTAVLGTPQTGDWTHLAARLDASAPSLHRGVLSPRQRMAALRESFRTVSAALADFDARHLDEALRLLRAEQLSRSERFIAPVRWLRELKDRPKGRAGENLLWRAVAEAPDGYCHPRASVLGKLIEGIAAGLSLSDLQAIFAEMVDPLQYQRPQSAPAAGNVRAAEDLVAKLGLAPALERRFATLDDVKVFLWRPRDTAKPERGGVFAHLTTKGEGRAEARELESVDVTWEKFARTVLPSATRLELKVPTRRASFIALTSAVHADAPPILRWDHEDERNPVAWYVYPSGSPASQWGLAPGTWVPVTAVTPLPTMWGSRPVPHLSEGAVLLLAGCVDAQNGGNALFPECLRADLHGVRATIESYSRSARLAGREKASACGHDVRKGRPIDVQVRAFVDGGWARYRIDRWD